ncbi:histidine phosphatase family protein [Alteromonas sp. AMM-1]|uniref:histidine phosphatase family protein n=1 Tax=Alteromonas sp. AMM-1 TaxID=3394233 RepID=UPI0039A50D10
MSCVYLLRHGQASFEADDYDALSALGEQQARRTGEDWLRRGIAFDQIVCGGMQRHGQTLSALQQGFSKALPNAPINPDWNEIDHHSVLGGFDTRLATAASMRKYLMAQPHPEKAFLTVFTQAVTRWQSGQYDADYTESWSAFKGRVISALDTTFAGLEKGQQALVVTSGGPIALVVASLMQLPETNWFNLNWTLVNTGITKILRTGGRLMVSSVNEHQHLDTPSSGSLITYK